MDHDIRTQLGGRERQIIDAVYRLGKATVSDVRAGLPDPPSYSAVRAMLNLLERKGYLRHERVGMKYVYAPVIAAKKAQASALRNLVSTFFGGSPIDAASALLAMKDGGISLDEKKKLIALIKAAQEDGR